VIGTSVLCNCACDGVAALVEHGDEHLATGRPILYTSQDSVVQLAAHVAVMAPEALYGACAALRGVLDGDAAVGRVIARPFSGAPGAFERTLGRRDYALAPSSTSYLDLLARTGVAVHGVGKTFELFAGAGFSEAHAAPTNARAIAVLDALIDELDGGLVYANLIETDQRYGHRKDAPGFHDALRQLDGAVAAWLERLREEDLLVITADHGCDPAAPHSDHTREHAPLLAHFAGDRGRRHDGALADVGASVLEWLVGERTAALPGDSFIADA
jgi:phosphopentomutase